MENNKYLQNCDDNDVLAFSSHKVFKLGVFKQAVRSIVSQLPRTIIESLRNKQGVDLPIHNEEYRLIDKGINCEILKIGSNGWQKGKFRIKITLEFCPDEPEPQEKPQITQSESPLDDLRQMIHQNNHHAELNR